MLISIETDLTCDISRGSGPPIPTSGSVHDWIRKGEVLETQQTQSLGPSSKLPLDSGMAFCWGADVGTVLYV